MLHYFVFQSGSKKHLNQVSYITNIPQVHHGIRLACMWPLFFAKKTITLSHDNMNVLLDGAKITRTDVTTIVRKTTLMGWSNQWLRNYYHRMQIAQPVSVISSPYRKLSSK